MTDEQIDLALTTLTRHNGNETAAAKELGVPRSTFRGWIAAGALKGKVGPKLGTVDPGFLLRRVSTLYGTDGEPTAEWVIQSPENLSFDDTIAAIEQVLLDRVNALPPVPTPVSVLDDDLVTVYLIVDHHLGLYSWEAETGANYDLIIASRTLRDSFSSLVAATPRSRKAIILNVGDFFHSDDNTNRTRRSGNILDADGRYAKILELGVDLEIEAVMLALSKHECVEVRNLPGNHDPYASIALNTGIRMAFRDNPRVHVSRDPSPFYFHQHGKVLIASTHGDMIRATDMPSAVAAYAPKEWGATEHRYIYLGHVHHASIGGGERYGAIWETFRTLAAKDAWAAQSGYASGRSMVAITHHKEFGEHMRNTVTIAGPGFKRGL